ncbi:MAG TPA: hypothetical protein VMW37_01130 [Dehalococcoidales bacterium]|nr:hypothetical protein [Dehalococcoidales bacterium]
MTLKEKLLNGEKLISIWDGFILKKWGLNIMSLEPSTGWESENYGGYKCVKF